MKLKLGDILLVRNYGLLGLYIRKMTKSKYNHCCIYIGRGIVVDTDLWGVRYRRITAYNSIPHKLLRVKNIPKKTLHKICKYARTLTNTGKRYNILSLFGIKSELGKTYNCSQMINSVYAKFSIILSDKFITVSPADIERSKLTYIVKK